MCIRDRPCPKSIFVQVNPIGSKYEIIKSIEPADVGVILLHLIKAEVNSIGFKTLDIKGLN